MTLDDAMLIMKDMLAYYGRKMPDTAQKHWCRGLLKYNAWAARKAMTDMWDSANTLPSRAAFMAACASRQEEMYPAATPHLATPDQWEIDLGQAVVGHFMAYINGKETLNEWANNFRAIARAQGVEDRIDWEPWAAIGAEFYV